MFEASVVMSRNWDAGEAGEEIGKQIKEKLKNKPKFVLLFSTIHYEKYGGFQKFLDAVNKELPEGTPVVGGTVAGFMNNQGCYTRGASAMAVYSDEMDVAVGVGHNTKRNPKKAGEECAWALKDKLKDSKYPNKRFILFVSSAIVPTLPILGNKKILKNIPFINQFLTLFDYLSGSFQIGAGRDEAVLETFSGILQDYSGIGGASCDDLKLEKNSQFFGKEVLTNSIVSVAFATSLPTPVSSKVGLTPTGKKLRITETSPSGYIIRKINGHPAVGEYLKVMQWDREVLDERLYRKVFYYPLVRSVGDEKEPRMFGLVYGENFVFPMKPVKDSEMEIHNFSGASIISSSSNLVEKGPYQSGFLISCGTRLETLGSKIFSIKENVFDKKFTGGYLVLYTAGEYEKETGKRISCLYQSDNGLFF